MKDRTVQVIAAAVIIIAGVAYLTFLVGTWNQMSQEHILRETRLNKLLDRFPVPAPDPEGSGDG